MKQRLPFTRGLCLLGLSVILSIKLSAGYDEMVVFGDSLSDNGNQSFVVGPEALASRNYDPLRFTNGPTTTPASAISGVMVEHLNTLLGLNPLRPALLGGSNYAWSGATTGFSGLDPANGIVPGTGTQVAAYLANHPSASPDSLYVLWAGGNDLFDSIRTLGIEQAGAVAMGNLKVQITTLLDAGAKNILWLNLPDLSLTPIGASLGPELGGQLHDATMKFRSDWSLSLQQFELLYPDATFTGVDIFGIMSAIVSDPSAFGVINITDPAQGLVGVNPDEYLFWDTLHPTSHAHRLLAQLSYEQLAAVPEPSGSIYFGFAVLALVGGRIYSGRRRQAGRVAPAADLHKI